MKKIINSISLLKKNNFADFSKILEKKITNGDELFEEFQTIHGIDQIFKQLSADELKIIEVLYSNNTGETIAWLEKETNLPDADISYYLKNLTSLLLTYSYKNMQHLNNRLNKVYLYSEHEKILNPISPEEFQTKLKELNKIYTNSKKYLAAETDFSEEENELLKNIFLHGGFIELTQIETNFQIIENLQQKNIIEIRHCLKNTFKTILLLNSKSDFKIKISHKKEKDLWNNYNLLNNFQRCYDQISEYGLFFTKQQIFRKVDFKRVADHLLPVNGLNGKSYDNEEVTFVLLQMFDRLGSLEKTNASVYIKLDKLKNFLDSPQNLLSEILKTLNKTDFEIEEFLLGKIKTPTTNELKKLGSLIKKTHNANYNILKAHFLNYQNIHNIENIYQKNTEQLNKQLLNNFKRTLDFGILAGLFARKNNIFEITQIYDNCLNLGHKEKNKENSDVNIYLNPDYSLMMPWHEICPEDLYILLGHVEMKKFDLMIEAQITQDSIIRAYKREMSSKLFLKTLQKYSQEKIPQNLNFQINDWIEQTIQIDIISATLLKSNHANFIDEITYSDLNKSIIERISPNHILIKKEAIDDFTRFAKQKNTIIEIYESN